MGTKIYLVIILVSSISFYYCSNTLSSDDYLKLCPYEFKYGLAHYLKVPISIVPHNQEYALGDSVYINLNFTNEIYDLTRNTTFTINEFPFKPIILIYRFNTLNEWDSGIDSDNYTIESKFFEDFFESASSPNAIYGRTDFKDSEYTFELKLSLNKKGVYVIIVTDQYMENLSSGNADLNEYANSIDFEGRCPETDFYICNKVESGSLNLDQYYEYVQFLDTSVYNNQLARINDLDSLGYFGNGSLAIDWLGFMTFEVI